MIKGRMLGLPGVRSPLGLPCMFAWTEEEILRGLELGVAVCLAGDGGCLTAWRDDSGRFRADAQRLMRSADERIFATAAEVVAWWQMWSEFTTTGESPERVN